MSISMPSTFRKTFVMGIVALTAFTSCKKEIDPVKPTYEVPTTYNFQNVNYSGQTARLDMLDELSKYMKSANTANVVLDTQKMKDMYANQNNAFPQEALNTSGKQLKDKTYSTDQPFFELLMDKLALASQSTTPGSNGVAGVVTSKDGAKSYLLDENGFEYAQIIEKGLMGALLYYQATAVYLSEEKTGDAVDNAAVKEGEGTKMEHHWDEAFGYLGVPVNFPTNTQGIRYWGKYVNSRDAKLGSNAKLMNAFLKGRAAISNKDMKGKNEAIPVIREEWEKAIAATFINYMNNAKTNSTDDAIRNHALSEAIGFIRSLKYNPAKKITDAQIDQVLAFIGTNLYDVKVTDLDKARDLIATVYGLNDMKDTL